MQKMLPHTRETTRYHVNGKKKQLKIITETTNNFELELRRDCSAPRNGQKKTANKSKNNAYCSDPRCRTMENGRRER